MLASLSTDLVVVVAADADAVVALSLERTRATPNQKRDYVREESIRVDRARNI